MGKRWWLRKIGSSQTWDTFMWPTWSDSVAARKKGPLERTSRDYNLIENQIELLTFLIIHRDRILPANRLNLNPAGEEMKWGCRNVRGHRDRFDIWIGGSSASRLKVAPSLLPPPPSSFFQTNTFITLFDLSLLLLMDPLKVYIFSSWSSCSMPMSKMHPNFIPLANATSAKIQFGPEM